MKRFISAVLIVIIVLSMNICVADDKYSYIPDHTSNFYVNDFAGILSEQDVKVLMDKAVKLALTDSNGYQVVVSTIETTKGVSIETYATDMYNKYKIGKDSMGVLVLLAIKDRKVRICTGKKMEIYITDLTAGKLRDQYCMEYFKKDEFPKGLISLQGGIIDFIYDKVPLGITKSSTTSQENTAVVKATKKATATPKPKATNVPVKEATKGNGAKAFYMALSSILGISLIVALCLMKKYKNEVCEKEAEGRIALKEERRKLTKEKDALVSVNAGLKRKLSESEAQNQAFSEWIVWIEECHPGIKGVFKVAKKAENDGNDIKDRAAAIVVSSYAKNIVYLEPSSKLYDRAKEVFEQANKLTDAQRLLLGPKFDEIQQFFKSCTEKRNIALANEAATQIRHTLSICRGVAGNLDKLNNVKKQYQALERAAKEYFKESNPGLLEQFDKRLRDAEEDRAQKEADKATNDMRAGIAHMHGYASEAWQMGKIIGAYKRLSSDVRSRMDSQVVERAQRYYDEAQRRKRDEEEEEERRRQEAAYSSSSSDFSSYGGFDGSSSGGGATGSF